MEANKLRIKNPKMLRVMLKLYNHCFQHDFNNKIKIKFTKAKASQLEMLRPQLSLALPPSGDSRNFFQGIP